ncbi:hypothetical protein AQUCO_00201434v1 [Aquilegia coerulea]|uniref:PsbQ-like protein 3, chloroplastic n=1 Tax=Aquilegia coerulea TaxID=218851 RepID=A0A2G5F821_AQUCA|nr:hypothetical protein AQUCO_00201434v1 [Aquilegia coerulea]
MAMSAGRLQPCHLSLSPTFSCTPKVSERKNVPQKLINRRIATIAVVGTMLLARDTAFNIDVAYGFDFRITVPDQTFEEADSVVREHAQDLLEVKPLIESELWRDAQKALRKSSSLLKQDFYTMIQAKPGSERPQLRKLYSQLFNNVTRLDYAARSKDMVLCKEYFENITGSLEDILSRITS